MLEADFIRSVQEEAAGRDSTLPGDNPGVVYREGFLSGACWARRYLAERDEEARREHREWIRKLNEGTQE